MDSLLFNRFYQPRWFQGVFRILFVAFLLDRGPVFLSPDLAGVPEQLYVPPWGPMVFFPAPNPVLVNWVNFAIHGLLWLLLLGIRTRWVSLLLGALLLVVKGWAYSLGKVNHDILFILVPLSLAFSRWGESLSVESLFRKVSREKTDEDTWPFGLLAIFLAFGMFTSGLQKVIGGWLLPSSLSLMGWVGYVREIWGRTPPGQDWVMTLHHALGGWSEVLDWLPVLFELTFPLALLGRSLFVLYCGLAVGFHYGTWMLFQIYFDHQVMVYLAFLPVARGERVWLGAVSFLSEAFTRGKRALSNQEF